MTGRIVTVLSLVVVVVVVAVVVVVVGACQGRTVIDNAALVGEGEGEGAEGEGEGAEGEGAEGEGSEGEGEGGACVDVSVPSADTLETGVVPEGVQTCLPFDAVDVEYSTLVNRVVAAATDGVHVMNPFEGTEQIAVVPFAVAQLAMAPQGHLAAVVDADGAHVAIVRLEDASVVPIVPASAVDGFGAASIAVDDDADVFVSPARDDQPVLVWHGARAPCGAVDSGPLVPGGMKLAVEPGGQTLYGVVAPATVFTFASEGGVLATPTSTAVPQNAQPDAVDLWVPPQSTVLALSSESLLPIGVGGPPLAQEIDASWLSFAGSVDAGLFAYVGTTSPDDVAETPARVVFLDDAGAQPAGAVDVPLGREASFVSFTRSGLRVVVVSLGGGQTCLSTLRTP